VPTTLPSPSLPTPDSLRATLASAVRYWEPRRVLYNLILAAVVAAWIIASWPHFRPAFVWSSLLFLIVAALLANLCYTSAYLIDFPLQLLSPRLTSRLRWSVWLLGTLLAMLLENYWIADEIYPFVR
jgi:hypothetical protein